MPRFYGKNWHNLDQQNRLFIPAKMRESLGDRFIIYKAANGEKCLFLYSMDTWEQMTDQLNNQPPSLQLTNQQRFLHLNSDDVGTDSKGRITINSEFCNFAGLEGETLIMGVGQRIEIWSRKEYEAMLAKAAEHIEYTNIDLPL